MDPSGSPPLGRVQTNLKFRKPLNIQSLYWLANWSGSVALGYRVPITPEHPPAETCQGELF